jgi:hypothetical protein
MVIIPRILVGVAALGSLILALGLWLGQEQVIPALGIATTDLAGGLVGRATVRADIAGLFGGMGICMLIAVIRQSVQWVNAVLVFVGVAITGRFIGLVMDGGGDAVIQPIIVEAATIGLLLWLRAGLSKQGA